MISTSPIRRPNMSPKRQAQYVMELEGRLREKENDAILAADIGQQLLRQVEKLQEQLNQREFNCGENIRPSSNLTTSSPTKSIGLGRSQIASAQAAINDLQKTNAELADRCEHQTSMIQQMQKAANDAEETIWRLELDNQELREQVEAIGSQLNRNQADLMAARTENSNLSAALAQQSAGKWERNRPRKVSNSGQTDRSCSPIKALNVDNSVNMIAIEIDAELKAMKLERDSLATENASLMAHLTQLRQENQSILTEMHQIRESIKDSDPAGDDLQSLENPERSALVLSRELDAAFSKEQQHQHKRPTTTTPRSMRLSAGIIAMEPRQHDRLPTLPGEGISIDIARQINLRQIEWTLRKIRLPSSKPNYSVELVDPDGEFDRSGANMGMRSGDDALTQSGARCGLNTSIELLHTMIGLWADKCSGSGRGRRYFWIVPWSRLLCWSKFHPSMGRPCVVRSVFIHSFIVDHNSMIAVRSGSEAKKLILKFKPSNEQDRQVWIRALQEVQETATSLLFQYHQKQQAL